MNLIRLTPGEAAGLKARVGDLHRFKSEIMHTGRDLSEFDLFKDIDSRDKRIYVALKRDPYANYEDSGISLYI
jgi:hypothetical protein